MSGKTAYVNGSRITGNIASMGGQTITPTASTQTISCSGKYMTGNITVKGSYTTRSISPVSEEAFPISFASGVTKWEIYRYVCGYFIMNLKIDGNTYEMNVGMGNNRKSFFVTVSPFYEKQVVIEVRLSGNGDIELEAFILNSTNYKLSASITGGSIILAAES